VSYKYLYSVGDSFSTDGNFKDFDTDKEFDKIFPSYSQIIAKSNNLELIDHSQGGAGNDYMFRRFTEYCISNMNKLPETIFIINFSIFESRFEFYCCDEHKYVGVSSDVKMTNKHCKKSSSFYKNLYYLKNGDYIKERVVFPIFYIYNFLKLQNIKFILSSTCIWDFKLFDTSDVTWKDYIDSRDVFLEGYMYPPNNAPIDKSEFGHYGRPSGYSYEAPFNTPLLEYPDDCASSIDCHPNKQGHEKLAKIFVSKFNKVYDLDLMIGK